MHLPDTITKRLNLMYGQPVDSRPTRDEYFSDIAQRVATRSTCPRASVGCVFVSHNHILSTGYNGSAAGLDHCLDVGCLMVDGHCLRCVHAEANAIIQCALHGVTTKSSTAYVTHYPCVHCSKMMINAGVVRVVYINEYAPVDGGDFFRQAGVSVERIEL